MKTEQELSLDQALDQYYNRFGVNFCMGGFGHQKYTCEEALACIRRSLETGIPVDQQIQYTPDNTY